MPIQVLADEVASQIAAGEVIERPASVVKELLENALDAGAGSIEIRIEGGGQRLIELSDDGHGIPAPELPLAVQRHATSKLVRSEDLFKINTLGFRGEALASIGSVARMRITSRAAAAENGASLLVEGGKVSATEICGAAPGTQVRVEDLFYNVPARRKFLKKEITERRQIDQLVAHYAIAYPDVRFRLVQEGRAALQTSGNGNGREALALLYDRDSARQMLEVLFEEDGLRITGFISPVALTRTNRSGMGFYVNRRPVQDAALAKALLQAYHTYLMVGRYPLAALFLNVDAADVDVNVHPTKAEVRFRARDTIFTSVQRAVRLALLSYTPVPRASFGGAQVWQRQEIDPGWEMAAESSTDGLPAAPQDNGSPAGAGDRGALLWEIGGGVAQSETPEPTQIPLSHGGSLLRLIGQMAAAYLVAEGPDGLYLIDQHAAHERVLYERFLSSLDGGVPAQTLLQPAAVELAPASARLLESQIPDLKRLGFEVEPFGGSTFLVRSVPLLLAGMEPMAALRLLVEDFEEDEQPLQSEREARLAARICKRAAVKAGTTLSLEEQGALLRDLEACQAPRTCPHGRPTMIHLSVDLLERQFGRRGAR